MPIVADRYRGTPEYFLVHAELVRAAQYRGVTTYQDIAMLMGLPLSGNLMGSEIGQILGEMVEDECARGRPMLSAVAVRVGGKPGTGFYVLARGLGKLRAGEDDTAFWQAERDRVYVAWRRPLRDPRDPASQTGARDQE